MDGFILEHLRTEVHEEFIYEVIADDDIDSVDLICQKLKCSAEYEHEETFDKDLTNYLEMIKDSDAMAKQCGISAKGMIWIS